MILPVPRRTAALAAALVAAVAAVLAGPVPASAADPVDPVITLQKPQPVAVATAAAPGTATTVSPGLDLTTTASSLETALTLTIDARRLAKIADVTFSDNCTVKNSVATCDEFLYFETVPENSTLGMTTGVDVTAKAGVAPGATASYTITGTAADATVIGTTGSVQVGGPAFSQSQLTNHSDVPTGSTVSEPVEFTNLGDRPAADAQVLLTTSPGLTFADHYANCKYSSVPNYQTADEALCTFPGPIQVGEHVALATAPRLDVTSAAYSTYLDTYTAAKGDAFIRRSVASRTWKQGKGATLGLTVIDPGQPSAAPAGKASLNFTDDRTNYRIATIQAANTADFAVTGAAAMAAQGSTVQLDFSMADNGPATIFNRSGEPIGVLVTPPPGTTVVGSSANCRPSREDNPVVTAHGPYSCQAGFIVPAGQVTAFSLTLRVDSVIPAATGTVAMDWSPTPGRRPAYDPDATNDSAALTLN